MSKAPFRALVLSFLVFASVACRSTGDSRPSDDELGLLRTLDALYEAFNFDPGGEPDWEAQRRIYLEGATFVPPASPSRSPVGEDTETFLQGFREYATRPPYSETGLHERIVDARVRVFGGVAHAFVLFEGFHPGDGLTRTRGVDSLQFVRDGRNWRLASFATQYEGPEIALPASL